MRLTKPQEEQMTDQIPSIADCKFYHAMDLPEVGFVQGAWDLRGRFDDYIGGVRLKDRSVLDVGAASGFLSFEAEQRGAQSVTSYNAASVSQLQRNPGLAASESDFKANLNSYRLAHHLLKSKAVPIFGDIYRLGEIAPKSDVVIVGQVLVHLRDPFGALEQMARCTADTLVIAEGMFDHPDPIAAYLGEITPSSWFHFSTTIYRQFLPKLGFEITSINPGKYRCVTRDKDEAVWTLVARRR
jgi:SAM-dependent methyltransferase